MLILLASLTRYKSSQVLEESFLDTWYLFPPDLLYEIVWTHLMNEKKMLRSFVSEWSLHSQCLRYWTATAQCMVGNESHLLKLFTDRTTAVKILASGTRAKSTNVPFQDSTHSAVDSHIRNVDVQNPTQLLNLPGDTRHFGSKSSQAIQLCYRLFLIASSSSMPRPNLQISKIKLIPLIRSMS